MECECADLHRRIIALPFHLVVNTETTVLESLGVGVNTLEKKRGDLVRWGVFRIPGLMTVG